MISSDSPERTSTPTDVIEPTPVSTDAAFGLADVRRALWSTELMTLGLLLLYTLLDLYLFAEVTNPVGHVLTNLGVAAMVVGFAVWYERTGNRVAYFLRSFYVLPVIYLGYAEVHAYIPHLNPAIFDPVLAHWDRLIFGVDPTAWLQQFSSPILTEYLQIWYCLFHAMLVLPAVVFYLVGRERPFRIYAMTLMFGFYLSYVLYFIMPAIGPRFYTHDFWSMAQTLPGIFFTEPIRAYINAANHVVPGANPYAVVNRDCMPSGHTMMSLLCVLLAWRYDSRVKWIVTIGGASVILSTVYLWYHYLVDVMAGAVCALIVFAIHAALVRMWERRGVKV